MNDEERSKYRDNARELRELAQQRDRAEARGRGDRDGRDSDRVARGERNRDSFRLPDSDQFRRSALREQAQRNRQNITDGQIDRSEIGRADRERTGREDSVVRDRDSRERDRIPGNRSGDSDSRVTTARELDEIQRNGRLRGDPRAETIPRGTEVTRRENDGQRREAVRPPRESNQSVERTPRTLEGLRRSDAARTDSDGRRQFDRGPRPEFDGNRRLGQAPSEIRRGEGSDRSSFRQGTPSTDGSPRIESRGRGQSSPSIERRSFTPPSESSFRKQMQRSQGRSNLESAPRSMRSEGSRGGENRSFSSGGGGGGENRSFRSGGSSNRGGGSAFRAAAEGVGAMAVAGEVAVVAEVEAEEEVEEEGVAVAVIAISGTSQSYSGNGRKSPGLLERAAVSCRSLQTAAELTQSDCVEVVCAARFR